jgi:DNA modification methylase
MSPLDAYLNKIICGNALTVLREMPDNLVNCVITSPPYWRLRDYGVEGQLGLEPTMEEYLEKMLAIFREIRRVLRPDGTLWLNLGDTYAAGGLGPGSGKQTTNYGSCNGRHIEKPRRAPMGLKPKDLVGIPWRVAFALQADGWYLRQDIIWHKRNAMPESVKDRPTRAHEYIFLLSKSRKYYYDYKAIMEPASPDTHARYARGRSDNHKWADGGPGDQTIAKSFEHMLKPGVNPKAAKAVPPSGWNTGEGAHDSIEHNQGDPLERYGRSRALMPKQNPYFSAAMKEVVEMRNKRSVWDIPTSPYSGPHYATFPPKLIEPCILAGCPEGGSVLDPFMGSGTTAVVSKFLKRNFIGIELNPRDVEMAEDRIAKPFKPRVVRKKKARDPQLRMFVK